MKTWHKAASAVAVAAVLFPQPAKALFGEDIPYLIQLVKQGVDSYRLGTEMRDAIQNAQLYFTSKAYWRGVLNQAVNGVVYGTQNLYGETAQWTPAMTTGEGVEAAWRRATLEPRTATWVANDPAAQSQLATLETLDAAAITGMTAHGQSLVAQQQSVDAVQRLEDSAMDTSPESNTEAAQLNLLTAGSAQSLRMQQTSNVIGLAQLQLLTTQVKAERDRIAQRLNYDADREQYQQTEGGSIGHMSQSMGWIPQ